VKVVIFCGGLGMRFASTRNPSRKPMVPVAIVHPLARDALLRALRSQGIHPLPRVQGRLDQEVLLEYDETVSNDFVFSGGARRSTCSRATSTTGRSPSWTRASHRTSACV